MRICVLGTRGFPFVQGGVERHCESLYPLFSDEFQFVIFRRKPYIKQEASSISYPNIRFIDLPSTRIKGVETLFHSFLATVLSIWQKPDIVHIHNIGPALFSPLLRLCGIKVVLTYHSPNYEHDKWNKVGKSVLRLSEKIALKMADAILFVNKFQMGKYPDRIREKSYYIPNGISKCERSSRIEYLKEWGLVPRKYILSVGRITPEKGFDCLIKAFNRIQDTDYKLVIAGGTETESLYEKQLKKIANERVVFTGFVYGEKLRQLYSHAGLFILASYNEGFPLVLLEAMSYQLDILASDIPACHLIEMNEDSYFSVGDDVILADKIQKRCGNVKVVGYDISAFSWNAICEQVATVYKDLCKEDN